MAKQAKDVSPAPELGERRAKKFLADVMERLENIESVKGEYMNRARQERDAIATLHEGLTPFGYSQKASKIVVKIALALEKIRGWQTELDLEDRRTAQKLTKLIDDQRQLSFWSDAPKAKKTKVKDMPPEQDLEITETVGAA